VSVTLERTITVEDSWRAGCLSYLLRRHGQRRFYDFVHDFKRDRPNDLGPVASLCHRHLGKTTITVIYGIERCLMQPGTHVLFLSPLANQTERNMEQPLSLILPRAPRGFRIKHSKADRQIIVSNPAWPRGSPPSVLRYLGTDHADGAHIRGCGRQDVVIVDEARDVKALKDFVQNVLVFSFTGTPDPLLVMISTPPASLDHDLVRADGGYVPLAIEDGRYFECRSSQNPDFSAIDRERILKACDGDDKSPFWLREAECQLIQDTERATIPEYSEQKDIIEIPRYERPRWFTPLIVADLGYDPDPVAVLGGYVDWRPGILVVEKARILKRANTRRFVEEILSFKKDLFPGRDDVKLYADATEKELDDFRSEHHVHMIPVDKYDKRQALRRLRTVVNEGRLRILDGAKVLRYQCLAGLLDKHGDLERTDTLGHQDATAALIYMARMAPWEKNPEPAFRPQETDVFVRQNWKPKEVLSDAPRLIVEDGAEIKILEGYIKPKDSWFK